MDAMKPVTRTLQTLAAIESELILAEAAFARLDRATSTGEIEKAIGGMQECGGENSQT